MALIKAKTEVNERSITYDSPIAALIQQRRYQMLVHSLLYYEADVSLVSDAKWQEWAYELVELQKAHPDIASRVIFAEAFSDFDGSTGFHLPYRDEQIVNIACRLLMYLDNDTAENREALDKLRYRTPRLPAEYDKYKKKSHAVKPTPVKKEVKQVEQKPRKGLFSVPRA